MMASGGTASSAFVIGHTGECGKELCRQLFASKRFSRVVLFGRKQPVVDLPSDGFVKVEVKIIENFDDLNDDRHAADFAGFSQGFCCLGSQITKYGKEAFYKIDYVATLRVAQMAKAGGCEHFHLVSSGGSKSNSWAYYLKTKGQVEEAIAALKFNRFSIYLPGMLLVDRVEKRPFEPVLQGFFKALAWVSPTLLSTPVPVVAKSMLAQSRLPPAESPTTQRLSIADMTAQAKQEDDASASH